MGPGMRLNSGSAEYSGGANTIYDPGSRFADPPPPSVALNRVYLAAGCVCVGRTPRASCQIDPIWCSSVSGPREIK